MALKEKGMYAALFAALSFLGGIIGNVASAAWRTDDRIDQRAAVVAKSVAGDESRRVIKEELGPAVGAAVAVAVKPFSDELIRHVALDDERQKRTDDEVQRLRLDGAPPLAHRGGR